MKNSKTCFGKLIEQNIIKSLRLAGAQVRESAELDHINKIDCTMRMNGQLLGIQISMRNDVVKARAAKCCALDVVPRFIYLRVGGKRFSRPDRVEGGILYASLAKIIDNHRQAALLVSITPHGVRVNPL